MKGARYDLSLPNRCYFSGGGAEMRAFFSILSLSVDQAAFVVFSPLSNSPSVFIVPPLVSLVLLESIHII